MVKCIFLPSNLSIATMFLDSAPGSSDYGAATVFALYFVIEAFTFISTLERDVATGKGRSTCLNCESIVYDWSYSGYLIYSCSDIVSKNPLNPTEYSNTTCMNARFPFTKSFNSNTATSLDLRFPKIRPERCCLRWMVHPRLFISCICKLYQRLWRWTRRCTFDSMVNY
jgi:hypothetical protein